VGDLYETTFFRIAANDDCLIIISLWAEENRK
jgi:hypothetical protein